MKKARHPRAVFTAICLTALSAFAPSAQAAPPDLTAAGVIATLKTDPASSPVYGQTYNLGATGLRGWIYLPSGAAVGNAPANGTLTGESRQILVTVASAPGSAVMAVDDVILGAMAGSSGTVPVFTGDARKAFGVAIGNAEKTGAGTLRVKRWRAGTTTDENIPMTILGDYTTTAPYNCPKSAKILANARTKLVSQLLADPKFLAIDYAGAVNGLALLAGVVPGDPDYAAVQTRLQAFARDCAASLKSVQGYSYPTWHLGYLGVFLSEYYLSTGDANVVSGLNNYVVALARMQGRYGTYGHGGSMPKADGSLHGTVPPYGPVNSAAIPANLAIVMGKKALLAAGQTLDPEIDPAIQRGSNFFGWFANKGGIPYGEHEPWMTSHSIGGRDAMCAVLFGIQTDRAVETEFFTRYTIASFDGREYGHAGGQAFSFLWHAIGANMGGELALGEYLKPIRWHLDLARRTDGSFAFEGQEQFGAGKTADGTYLGESRNYDFQTTASYLITYSLPLKQLYITGKNANPANTLDAAKVANAIAAATFSRDVAGFTTTQLIAAVGEFDPVVRKAAAVELSKRSLTPEELTTLRGMVTGTDANGRMGACETLGLLKDATALPLITQRLDKTIETNSWVRAKAASALRSYPAAAVSTYRDPLLTAFVTNATDPEATDWNDPLQFANGYLSFALFGGGLEANTTNVASSTISASKNLLYPAVKVGLKQPDAIPRGGVASFCAGFLTLPDVKALVPDLIEVAAKPSEANTMFSGGPRAEGINTLAKWKISEGIPVALAMLHMPNGFTWGSPGVANPALNALVAYGNASRPTLPALRGYIGLDCEAQGGGAGEMMVPQKELLAAIAAIENATTAPSLIPGLAVAAPPDLTAAGVIAAVKPLFDYPVRDTSICLGPDGIYYLIGTTGHPTWWQVNDGVRMWQSRDLKTWDAMGLVWSYEKNATWQKVKTGPDGKKTADSAIWAPELHYFKNTYWIAYSMNYEGTGILKSTSGRPDGPYVDVKADGPLTGGIDASLLADDDGAVYFVWQNGNIARMKDDMSGLAEPARLLKPANADAVGFEGACITKINGRYHLICADFNNADGKTRTYDCMAASADKIYGPYGDRYLAIPSGGHNVLFHDKQGQWWSTFFGNDDKAPFKERPAVLRITIDKDNRIMPLGD